MTDTPRILDLLKVTTSSEATGELLQKIPANVGEITHVWFTPDGGRLFAAGDDKTVRFWDLELPVPAVQAPEA